MAVSLDFLERECCVLQADDLRLASPSRTEKEQDEKRPAPMRIGHGTSHGRQQACISHTFLADWTGGTGLWRPFRTPGRTLTCDSGLRSTGRTGSIDLRARGSAAHPGWLITQRCMGVCDSCIWLMTMAVPWMPSTTSRPIAATSLWSWNAAAECPAHGRRGTRTTTGR